MNAPANSVPIDDDQVKAELEELAGAPIEPGASAGGAPPPPGPPAAPPAPPMDWTLICGALVLVVDKIVAPNWQLQNEEKDLLLEQTKVTFAVFFPNANVDPRVQAILALGGTMALIASKRFDPEMKRLKPLRVKPAPTGEGDPDAGEDRAQA